MRRVKRGVTARARHKKVLQQARGFRGRRGNVYRVAKQAVMKAGQYAYRDRRLQRGGRPGVGRKRESTPPRQDRGAVRVPGGPGISFAGRAESRGGPPLTGGDE